MRIGITGSTGFVGNRLMSQTSNGMEKVAIDLRAAKISGLDLKNIDAIIHLAGKAHAMQPVPDKEYFDINYELTRSLAATAKSSGVSQFIYISSTKVYGDSISSAVNESSECIPTDAYGQSKLDAERYLLEQQSPDFIVSIIRPPLIYGPGVKGNLIKLLHLADKNMPLPFGKTNNKRSMVFLDNLIALMYRILEEKKGGIFVAGDKRSLSTDELLSMIRKSLGNNSGLVAIPGFARQVLKYLRPSLHSRLFGSFEVDNEITNKKLNFAPPFTSEQGIKEMVDWYVQTKNQNRS